jgi:poly(A) polymerase Pap1
MGKAKEGVVRNEEIQELNTKAKKLAEKHSPDLNKMQKVKINKGTYIYIGIDKDPEVARKKFIEKINSSSFTVKYKNYDIDTE